MHTKTQGTLLLYSGKGCPFLLDDIGAGLKCTVHQRKNLFYPGGSGQRLTYFPLSLVFYIRLSPVKKKIAPRITEKIIVFILLTPAVSVMILRPV